MLALTIIGNAQAAPHQDAESRCAQAMLLRQLAPFAAPRLHLAHAKLSTLVQAARTEPAVARLDARSPVLLLHNDCLGLAPHSVERLLSALEQGASAALCADPGHAPPTLSPDYATLRGLERYVARTATLPDAPVALDAEVPALALLTRAGTLRDGSWASAGRRVWGAWAHDFSGYRSSNRAEMLDLLPQPLLRVLDVGGGKGGFLAEIKRLHPHCETHLAEHDSLACAQAAHLVDRVWQGDFLTASIAGPFDCISFLDVLEHVAVPQTWLERARSLLGPGGSILASVPNVGHWTVVADLMEGRWDYAPAGIHCITHLRFYTRPSLLALLDEAGLAPVQMRAQRIEPPPGFNPPALATWLVPDLDSLSTYAFHVLAQAKA